MYADDTTVNGIGTNIDQVIGSWHHSGGAVVLVISTLQGHPTRKF